MKMYETFWPRAGARLIDGLVLSPFTILSTVLLVKGISYRSFLWLNLATFAGTAAYFTLLTCRYGQTVGKMATGVKIIKLDGARLTYSDALVRFFAAGWIGLCITAGFLVMHSDDEVITVASLSTAGWINWANALWLIAQLCVVLSNERRRAIHDYVADTQVVVKKHFEAASAEELLILASEAKR